MEVNALVKAGLKNNEAKIYLDLIDNGISLVSQIYKRIGIHRRNVYDSLSKLQEKGLVSEITRGGKKHFEAVNPNKLLSYLEEKQESIQLVLPELMNRFGQTKSEDEGQMFKGIEGIKTIMQDILEVGKPMYFIGAKGKWLSDELRFFFPRFERERIKKRVRMQQIFDYEVKSKRIPNIEYSEHKFFPKKYSSPTHIWIYGDRVVTIFWGTTKFAFMIKSKEISLGYKKFFDYMWSSLAR